jgi:hypothetical protein
LASSSVLRERCEKRAYRSSSITWVALDPFDSGQIVDKVSRPASLRLTSRPTSGDWLSFRSMQNSVVVVSGGANEIGAEVSARLVSEGARLLIADLNGAQSESKGRRHRFSRPHVRSSL